MQIQPCHRLIVADGDNVIRRDVQQYLETLGFSVDSVSSTDDLLTTLTEKRHEIVIADCHLDGDDGLDMLVRLQRLQPKVTVVLMMSDPSVEAVIAAFRRGAVDFIIKPFTMAEINQAVGNAVTRHEYIKHRQEPAVAPVGEP